MLTSLNCCFCLPVIAQGLKGLEILVNFTGVDSDVRIPTELVIPRLSAAEELALFNEKLQLLDTCKLFLFSIS